MCKENVGHPNSCSEGKVAEGTFIKGVTLAEKPATLLSPDWGGGGKTQIECDSEALGEVGKNEGSHKGRLGLITKVSFTECTVPCEKVTAENLPYQKAAALKLHALVSEDGKGRPAIRFECASTAFFIEENVTCLYEFSEAEMLFDIESDKLIAKQDLVDGTETRSFLGLGLGDGSFFSCPLTGPGTFDATYLLTLDNAEAKPVYIAGLP